MSKVGDVKNMYGQDFGILITNAPSNIINNYSSYSLGNRLTPNVLLISSPTTKDGNDKKIPSLFVTDYNGLPLQITYAINFGNGLMLSDSNNVQLNIDNSTIKVNNNDELYVDTSYLQIGGNNTVGLLQTNETISRGGEYPSDTFISSNNVGTIYLASSFFDYMNERINTIVNQKIAPLISSTLIGWNEYNNSKYYTNDTISLIQQNKNEIPYILFDFYFKSMSSVSENVIIASNSIYPIYNISKDLTSVVIDEVEVGDQTIYTHKVSDIKIDFFPNYNIIGNEISSNLYSFSLRPYSWEDLGNITLLNVYQEKTQNYGISLLPLSISVHTLVQSVENLSDIESIVFTINNNFADNNLSLQSISEIYENKISFELNINYLISNGKITLYSSNVNDLISQQQFTVNVPITSEWVNNITTKSNNNSIYESSNNVTTRYEVELKIIMDSDFQKSYTSITDMSYDWNVKSSPQVYGTSTSSLMSINTDNNDSYVFSPSLENNEQNYIIITDKSAIVYLFKNAMDGNPVIFNFKHTISNITNQSLSVNTITIDNYYDNFANEAETDSLVSIFDYNNSGSNSGGSTATINKTSNKFDIGVNFRTDANTNTTRNLVSRLLNINNSYSSPIISINFNSPNFAEQKTISFGMNINELLENESNYKIYQYFIDENSQPQYEEFSNVATTLNDNATLLIDISNIEDIDNNTINCIALDISGDGSSNSYHFDNNNANTNIPRYGGNSDRQYNISIDKSIWNNYTLMNVTFTFALMNNSEITETKTLQIRISSNNQNNNNEEQQNSNNNTENNQNNNSVTPDNNINNNPQIIA